MMKRGTKMQMWFWLLALVLMPMAASHVLAQTKPAATQTKPVVTQTKPATPPAAAAKESGYVGAETCQACHQDLYNSWAKSPHWKTTLEKREGPSHQGCEGCHGPGQAHVEGGGDKKKIYIFKEHSAEEVNARCLNCHASGPSQLNSANSFHRQNEVSCIDCHSPHHPATKEFLLVKAQPALCYSCHLQQKSQFGMPFRHRVNEGLIQCSDCHNQHGSGAMWTSDHLIRQVRTSNSGDDICFKCHTDKQGPFVYEHGAVRVAGCATCHIPHGGANPHMLKYSNVNLLCFSCHTRSATAHGLPMSASFGTQEQSCTLCHVAIHGSNFNSNLFR
jgi:DmsE family decaheme c-type cytochrome